MKKIIAVVASAVMTMMFYGCGDNQTDITETSASEITASTADTTTQTDKTAGTSDSAVSAVTSDPKEETPESDEVSVTSAYDSSEHEPEEDVGDDEKFNKIHYVENFSGNVCKTNLTADAGSLPQIDVLKSYDELVTYYESYKDIFDLDSEFSENIGKRYDERFFSENNLFVIAAEFPDSTYRIWTEEVITYRRELYFTVGVAYKKGDDKGTECYHVLTSISKSECEGLNLNGFSIYLQPETD